MPAFIFTNKIILSTSALNVFTSMCYMAMVLLLPTFLEEAKGFSARCRRQTVELKHL